ncbi:WD40 repeat domain-containing protein [Stratiformator vulcanicus]|uniref:WD40 repeat domain-containing protein n=1 Tax=Stratiformator vulcanicus TaxID=2527980 RepID=UPI0011A3CDD7|nr:WD40 repeat domain-containing protein [Stratiformator vulcanicus]
MGLAELRRRLGPEADSAEGRRLLSPWAYFYNDLPGEQLYLPLPLRAERSDAGAEQLLKDAKPHAERVNPTLSAMLRHLGETGDTHGVLLLSRSGAGKTVACRRAFFDCFPIPEQLGVRSERVGQLPELAGYLPCWAEVGAKLSRLDQLVESCNSGGDRKWHNVIDDTLERINNGDWILELIAQTSGRGKDQTSGWSTEQKELIRWRLKRWLTTAGGPKLLLFVDLNSADSTRRQLLAKVIRLFQRDFGEYGHRVVVTYRSTASGDAVMTELWDDEQFVAFDLEPIHPQNAEDYLRNFRGYEQYLRKKLGLPVLQDDVESECRKLGEFIRRHAKQESLISTPLLTHFVASLEGERLEQIDSLFDLYDAVVDQHIIRDINTYGRQLPTRLAGRRAPALVRTALCRLALAILPNEESTRLDSLETAICLLEDPLHLRTRWWPEDECWHQGSYFTEEFSESEQDTLLEFSLLRKDGNGVGFLHDSLLYYFAALTLRYSRRPGRGALPELPKEWAEQVVRRIRTTPRQWMLPAEFLGGTLADEILIDLAERLVASPPKDGLPRLVMRLLEGSGSQHEVLTAMLQAIRWHGPFVYMHPATLIQEVYNFFTLKKNELDSLSEAVDRVKRIFSALHGDAQWPWLAEINTMRSGIPYTISLSGTTCKSIRLSSSNRVIALDSRSQLISWNVLDGTLIKCNQYSLRFQDVFFITQDEEVFAITCTQIVHWDLRENEIRILYQTEKTITAAARIEDGLAICTGEEVLYVELPASRPESLFSCCSPVETLKVHFPYICALTTDRQVVAYNFEERVMIDCITIEEEADDFSNFKDSINLFLADSGWVLLMMQSGNIIEWNPKAGIYIEKSLNYGGQQFEGHKWIFKELQCLGENAILLLASHVFFPDIDNPAEAVMILGPYSTLLAWDIGISEVRKVFETKHTLNCMLLTHVGLFVGDDKGNLLQFTDLYGPPKRIKAHRGGVTCLACNSDGSLVSAGEDKTLSLWTTNEGIQLERDYCNADGDYSCEDLTMIGFAGPTQLILHDGERNIFIRWEIFTNVKKHATHRIGADYAVEGGPYAVITSNLYGEIAVIDEFEAMHRDMNAGFSDTSGDAILARSKRFERNAMPPGPAFRPHNDRVSSIVPLIDGRWASAGQDGKIEVWDPRPAIRGWRDRPRAWKQYDWGERASLKLSDEYPTSVAVFDSSTLVIGTSRGSVYKWNIVSDCTVKLSHGQPAFEKFVVLRSTKVIIARDKTGQAHLIQSTGTGEVILAEDEDRVVDIAKVGDCLFGVLKESGRLTICNHSAVVIDEVFVPEHPRGVAFSTSGWFAVETSGGGIVVLRAEGVRSNWCL